MCVNTFVEKFFDTEYLNLVIKETPKEPAIHLSSIIGEVQPDNYLHTYPEFEKFSELSFGHSQCDWVHELMFHSKILLAPVKP